MRQQIIPLLILAILALTGVVYSTFYPSKPLATINPTVYPTSSDEDFLRTGKSNNFGMFGPVSKVERITLELAPNKDDKSRRAVFYFGKHKRITISEFYDSESRISRKDVYKYSNKGKIEETKEFDSEGTLVGKWVGYYDNKGNYIEEKHFDPDGNKTHHREFEPNQKGEIVLCIIHESSQESGSEIRYIWTYDKKGRKLRCIDIREEEPVRHSEWTYDRDGNSTKKRFNKDGRLTHKITYSSIHSEKLLLELIEYGKDGSIKHSIKYAYSFDKWKNWTKNTIEYHDKDQKIYRKTTTTRKIDYRQ